MSTWHAVLNVMLLLVLEQLWSDNLRG